MQSIKENGVLTPVLAHRDSDGQVTVRAGQRRVFAAREAGLTTIPVYLVDAHGVAAERIVQQMVENDQRETLTDSDRAAAFQGYEWHTRRLGRQRRQPADRRARIGGYRPSIDGVPANRLDALPLLLRRRARRANHPDQSALQVRTHVSRVDDEYPHPDHSPGRSFCLPFRRGDQWRVEGAEVPGPWNTGGSAASEDMPRKPGTEAPGTSYDRAAERHTNRQRQRRRRRLLPSLPERYRTTGPSSRSPTPVTDLFLRDRLVTTAPVDHRGASIPRASALTTDWGEAASDATAPYPEVR
ncbi:ParB/RepB/Spo0J family partition protein [Leifsonia shinshuensis]|uniref:ParB/RepB/Spo0J family partition protein n=2 Tax=Microbacteriaceae TaxID=85023 RepID=UPI0021561C9F|nr:ParB/RepB/Spo0J family partition protein [Leifsonia shinshuensis]